MSLIKRHIDSLTEEERDEIFGKIDPEEEAAWAEERRYIDNHLMLIPEFNENEISADEWRRAIDGED